jgi:hypothetical protein
MVFESIKTWGYRKDVRAIFESNKEIRATF